MTTELPEMTPVKSSNIAAIGHDGAHTFVKFMSGGVWRYTDVPADKHQEFLNAPSPGKHFLQHIKAKHEGVKVS